MIRIETVYENAFFTPETVLRQDLQKIAEAGFNTVSIFLPACLFVGSARNTGFSAAERLLALAEEFSLELSFRFDFSDTEMNLTEKKDFLRNILSRFQHKNAVSKIWNLGPLPPMDVEDTGKTFVQWLKKHWSSLECLNRALRLFHTRWERIRIPVLPDSPLMPEYRRFEAEQRIALAAGLYVCAKEANPLNEYLWELSSHDGSGEFKPDFELREMLVPHSDALLVTACHTLYPRDSAFLQIAGEAAFADEHCLYAGETADAEFAENENESLIEWLFQALSCNVRGLRFRSWKTLYSALDTVHAVSGFVHVDSWKEKRFALLRCCAELTGTHGDILENFVEDEPEIALFTAFENTRFFHSSGAEDVSRKALRGWINACIESSVPFRVVHRDSMKYLTRCRLLIVPRTPVLDDASAEALLAFVVNGGVLYCEGETGSWDSFGFERDPDRVFLAESVGICNSDRCTAPDSPLVFKFMKRELALRFASYLRPVGELKKFTEVFVGNRLGALLEAVPYGNGRILLCGGFPATSYDEKRYPAFENFLGALMEYSDCGTPLFNIAGKSPKNQFGAGCFVKTGESCGKRVIFVQCAPSAERIELTFRKDFRIKKVLTELLSGKKLTLTDAGNGAKKLIFKPSVFHTAIFTE